MNEVKRITTISINLCAILLFHSDILFGLIKTSNNGPSAIIPDLKKNCIMNHTTMNITARASIPFSSRD